MHHTGCMHGWPVLHIQNILFSYSQYTDLDMEPGMVHDQLKVKGYTLSWLIN